MFQNKPDTRKGTGWRCVFTSYHAAPAGEPRGWVPTPPQASSSSTGDGALKLGPPPSFPSTVPHVKELSHQCLCAGRTESLNTSDQPCCRVAWRGERGRCLRIPTGQPWVPDSSGNSQSHGPRGASHTRSLSYPSNYFKMCKMGLGSIRDLKKEIPKR